mgnify:FL=1
MNGTLYNNNVTESNDLKQICCKCWEAVGDGGADGWWSETALFNDRYQQPKPHDGAGNEDDDTDQGDAVE